ncbi:unnamed protein product [Toxocara canis]|uniref:Protein YIF1 n=1 Tax=Toxocara canis TaxID=6265 RepID=A0A183TXF3_TOXCA|nr:unnamed protein product [Toxocara canis]
MCTYWDPTEWCCYYDWTVLCDSPGAPTPSRYDVNAPDLYIPLMAFITYCRVPSPLEPMSLSRNGDSESEADTQQQCGTLPKAATSCRQVLSHTAAPSTSSSDPNQHCDMLFIILRTVNSFLLDVHSRCNNCGESKKRKLGVVLFISFTEPFIIWWLASGVTAFVAGKFDFAWLTLSGIGLCEVAKKGQLPLLADCVIDYGAVLKMPQARHTTWHLTQHVRCSR